jgi:hypothetical protein
MECTRLVQHLLLTDWQWCHWRLDLHHEGPRKFLTTGKHARPYISSNKLRSSPATDHPWRPAERVLHVCPGPAACAWSHDTGAPPFVCRADEHMRPRLVAAAVHTDGTLAVAVQVQPCLWVGGCVCGGGCSRAGSAAGQNRYQVQDDGAL